MSALGGGLRGLSSGLTTAAAGGSLVLWCDLEESVLVDLVQSYHYYLESDDGSKGMVGGHGD